MAGITGSIEPGQQLGTTDAMAAVVGGRSSKQNTWGLRLLASIYGSKCYYTILT